MHVAHGCNLSCESCSHYSNQGHRGLLSVEEADRWIGAWSTRLNLQTFTLLGGEPTINSALADIFLVARQYWPLAHLKLITNGFFLHRHPKLLAMLKSDTNMSICLSIHHDSPEYRERIKPILDLLNSWARDFRVRVEYILSYKNWTLRYHGHGNSIEPYSDKRQRQSWENCPAKYTPQLHDGKLWKCAPLAYLQLQKMKFDLSDKWDPYLAYQSLAPECNEKQLSDFFHREDEEFCGMCPANPVRIDLPLPLKIKR